MQVLLSQPVALTGWIVQLQNRQALAAATWGQLVRQQHLSSLSLRHLLQSIKAAAVTAVVGLPQGVASANTLAMQQTAQKEGQVVQRAQQQLLCRE
jgi:hypothetical protein